MARPVIPERQPIGDEFPGAVVQAGQKQALTFAPEGADVLFGGPCILRYGVRYLGKPNLSIVPGLVVMDYGEMLTGEAAWDFLIHHSNRYPRAEVFGYRNDGRDEIMRVRALDFALTPEALAYGGAQATAPIARPTALIASEASAAALPARLTEALSRFDTLEDWQSQPTL
ncbi:MAG TPA: hypothetical protein VER79_05480 [Candidatus Limnocylindrales bacterium]|nr:hypothetical protein [Candidatus Limnocylindrales bacterium]